MLISKHITPVMYTDSTGYAPKWISVFAIVGTAVLIAAAIAVTVSTFGAGSPLAVMAITTGIAVLAQSAAVGKSQYNKSRNDGDSSSDTYDDVVDAVGEVIFDEIFLKTLGFKTHVSATALIFNVAFIQTANGPITSIPSAFSNAFKSTTINGNPGAMSRLGNAVAYGFAAYYVIDTAYYWSDDNEISERGEMYGWDPR